MLIRYISQLSAMTIKMSLLSMILFHSTAGLANDFFESRIRPVLVAECYECHGVKKQKGGLRLDYRGGMLEGGDSGDLLNLENPGESLLVKVLRHEIEDLEMPKDGAQLTPEIINDFVKWIADGAPDPRIARPTEEAVAAGELDTWKAAMEFRKSWWSFQPLTNPDIPELEGKAWGWTPVDSFLQKKWEEHGLDVAKDAPLEQVVRRLHYVLTGLPPSYQEVEAFVKDATRDRKKAIERKVDELLNSDHFGEKWARHWMDWYRFASTHGSEGDPQIPNAWQYRDYLIRALNSDVPYDQMIREHIAGDLMEDPRINEDLGIVESRIGPAHYRMVLHGFAPTDAHDELVRFTENQIDTVFKSIQGMTVSCARCHNHKFDPISQEDFYAAYGVMATTRPALITVDTPEKTYRNYEHLKSLKSKIRSTLADHWLNNIKGLNEAPENAIKILTDISGDKKSATHPAFTFREISIEENPESRLEKWAKIQNEVLNSKQQVEKRHQNLKDYPSWNFNDNDSTDDNWFTSGPGLEEGQAPDGSFAVAPSGDQALRGIYPAGFYSHLVSEKHRGLFESPKFRLHGGNVFFRVAGGGNAAARYVIQHYPRNGTVYPTIGIGRDQWRWESRNLKYWAGDDAHLEIATAADQPVLARDGQTRSWFGVTDVMVVPDGSPSPKDEPYEFSGPLFELQSVVAQPARDKESMAMHYLDVLNQVIKKWEAEDMSSSEAYFMASFLGSPLLPNDINQSQSVKKLIEDYRRMEDEIPMPTRVPGVSEGTPLAQQLMIRGNHKSLGKEVPRRYLDVFGAKKFETDNSGRLELAESILDPANTLTSRVIANRIWHYVFGRGIVATPDNFGRLGEKPSHPELLDFLATRMQQNNWSIKSAIRALVTSRAFQVDSSTTSQMLTRDPENKFLTRFKVRRLDAENIRDSILSVSGNLDTQMYGGPASDNSSRRSVYLRVVRNRLHPFLASFDFPAPVATLGSRDVTNVPAQSLQMMNNEFVISAADRIASQAQEWAESNDNLDQIVTGMFQSALKRQPSPNELKVTTDWIQQRKLMVKDAAAEKQSLENQIQQLKMQIEAIHNKAVTEYLASLKSESSESAEPSPAPDFPPAVMEWNFSDPDAGAQLKMNGKVKIENGALILDGSGFARTEAIDRNLKEKTLSATISMNDPGQKGGGVITVETRGGQTFDSIVFAERQNRRWMAGSDTFKRTTDLGGPEESTTGDDHLIHLAVTYKPDGTIAFFRNGEPYGKPYKMGGPVQFNKGDWHITLGLRHLPDSNIKRWKGKVYKAAVFDKALDDDQIRFLASGDASVFTLQNSLAALPEKTRQSLDKLKASLNASELSYTQLTEIQNQQPDPLRDLAQSLLNTKEFLFLY